jgi:hypothetical protein
MEQGYQQHKGSWQKMEDKIVGTIAYLSSWGNNIHIFAGRLLRSTWTIF